jgi:hypothetical protein
MPYHLAQFMAKVFPPGTDADRETYQSLTGATPPTGRSTPSKPKLRPDPTGPFKLPSPEQIEPDPTSDETGFASDETVRSPPGFSASVEEDLDVMLPRSSSRWIGITIALLLLAGIGITAYLLLGRGREPVVVVTPDLDAAAARATDGSAVAAPAPAADGSRAAVPDVTTVVLGTPPPPDTNVKRDAQPVARIHRRPIRRPVARRRVGTITVQAPGPGEVLLGRRRLGVLPLGKTTVVAGTHRLVVQSRQRGYRMVREIPVSPGSHQDLRFKPEQGTILVLVHPWAKVTLDGKLLGITPLKPIKVLEGPHLMVLENSELKVKRKRLVQVRPGRVEKVKLVLE